MKNITSVASNDFYFDGMMRLSEDFLISQYKKLVDLIHAQDCAVISQLTLGAFYRKNIQVEGTGHTYQMKHQETAEKILKQIQDWEK